MNMAEALYTHRGFYSIREVCEGNYYMSSERVENKMETTIKNALNYTMKFDIMSHMSLQGFATFSNGKQRDLDVVPSYYPFVVEFEPSVKPGEIGFNTEYTKAIQEALRFYIYLKYNMVEDCRDIAIFITPSRSIYIMLNPKIFGATQSTMLHLIYKEMFDTFNQEIELDKNYVDNSFFKKYQILKTPNSLYNGGYVVPITGEELQKLANDPGMKERLTSKKRNLFKIWMPCTQSYNLSKIYMDAKEAAKEKYYNKLKSEKVAIADVEFVPPCLMYANELNKDQVEGNVNFLLTTNAIIFKNKKRPEAEALEFLQKLAQKWQYDQPRNVKSIINSVYRHDTNFSCTKIKDNLGIKEEDVCLTCPYCSKCKCYEKADGFTIHTDILQELISNNKAYKRHYEAYLVLSRHSVWGKEISREKLEEFKIDKRTVDELCKLTGYISLQKTKQGLIIENTAMEKAFVIPYAFVDAEEFKRIGTRLKHYLAMYCLAWRKAPKAKTHIYFKLNKEAAMELLKLKSDSSYYKMLKELESLGLLEHIENGFVRVFFRNNKVIEFKDYVDKKAKVEQIAIGPIVEKLVVGDTNVQQTRLLKNGGVLERYKGPPE